MDFGGKIVVFGGDFRETLPTVRHASEQQIINVCINRSMLWRNIHKIKLKTNMRVSRAANQEEAQSFADFLLRVGEGREPTVDGKIRLPDSIVSKSKSVKDFVKESFPNLSNNVGNGEYFAKHVILTPTNADVHDINSICCESLSNIQSKTYISADSVEEDLGHVFPMEYLNSLTPSGMPKHKLELKVGVPVLLLRNLNPAQGLCNGTRMIVTGLHPHVIEAKIITGDQAGQSVFLPRITLQPSDNGMPFVLRRRQFPLTLAFAITINKAQGQTLEKAAVYLPTDVFGHGQLYVALSRPTSPAGLKVYTQNGSINNKQGVYTKNVVYRSVL